MKHGYYIQIFNQHTVIKQWKKGKQLVPCIFKL